MKAKWMKKLTKKELHHMHVTQSNRQTPTLAGFKRNRQHQIKENIECFECRHIALKLGLEA